MFQRCAIEQDTREQETHLHCLQQAFIYSSIYLFNLPQDAAKSPTPGL